MVRGRTTAPHNLVLGHEILREVAEVGSDVEFSKVGDICSVPFNIAGGSCRNCKEGKTGICLNVHPARPGAAYGYAIPNDKVKIAKAVNATPIPLDQGAAGLRRLRQRRSQEVRLRPARHGRPRPDPRL